MGELPEFPSSLVGKPLDFEDFVERARRDLNEDINDKGDIVPETETREALLKALRCAATNAERISASKSEINADDFFVDNAISERDAADSQSNRTCQLQSLSVVE